MTAQELFQKLTGAKLAFVAHRDNLDSEQTPVHPIIAERLAVQWVTPGMRFRHHSEHLMLEEYALRYMAVYDGIESGVETTTGGG